jgi:hypothetical protein
MEFRQPEIESATAGELLFIDEGEASKLSPLEGRSLTSEQPIALIFRPSNGQHAEQSGMRFTSPVEA